MYLKTCATIALLYVAAIAFGQAIMPTSRPSTVGKIAASAADVSPLSVGDTLPKLTLKGIDGQAYDLNAAVARKPTVLIFYRGGWCPYCKRQLSGLQGVLDELTDAGYQLLAVSPDKPQELANTREEEQATFTFVSDSDASAMRAFGLAFQAPAAQFKTLEQYSGQTHHLLPVPALYVFDTHGKIRFAHFDPDFRVRMNPSEVLEQAKAAITK